jgi:Zn-dependent protease
MASSDDSCINSYNEAAESWLHLANRERDCSQKLGRMAVEPRLVCGFLVRGFIDELMTSGWRIGSIFGIPFLLNPAWFYSLGLFTFLFSAGDFGLEGRLAWLAGFSMALLLFASVLLHELGHSLAARAQGIVVNAITLFPFGGIASIAQESKTPKQAFWVAISGPMVSFVLFVLLLLLSLLLPETSVALPFKAMLGGLANINFVMALFNLMPGLPLDGGQVLKAAVWHLTGSRVKGVRWAARGGQILGWAAILLGLSGFLLTLRFGFLWLVLLGGFGIRRASAYGRMITLQQAMLQILAVDAMRREFATAIATVSLHQSIEQFAASYLASESEIYYAESEGQYVGWVEVEAINQLERSEWQQPLAAIVQPLAELPTLPEDASLAMAILQLERHELRQMPILSAAGAVVGVIDRADVVRALGQRLALLVPPPVIEQIKTSGQFPANLQLQDLARDALS